MTLTELRDALANATGPDCELDCAIYEMMFGPKRAIDDDRKIGRLLIEPLGRKRYFITVPPYTASIDAAVTLVDGLAVSMEWGAVDGCRVEINDMSGRFLVSDDIERHAHAATGALALCLVRIEYELAKAQAAEEAGHPAVA